MARTVEHGIWHGQTIRTARKAGPCQYGLVDATTRERCENVIAVGDEYFEGEHDDFRAGGYAMKRFCLRHLEED